MLTFSINKQIITRTDVNKPVSNSVDYLQATFSFSSDWDGTMKTAIFKRGLATVKAVVLENDSCLVPWEIIHANGFQVSIVGVGNGQRITTNPVFVDIKASGPLTGDAPVPFTPSQYEQIMSILEHLQGGAINKVLAKKSNKDFDFKWVNNEGGGGGGSSVEWEQIVEEGIKIATITIDDTPIDVYVPEGLDGESAYEIAVDHGYEGTEEEWLASLKGEQGIQGPPGADGQDGAQGPAGKDGKDGINGQDGADGESAYEIAVDHGYSGTEEQWLASLVGPAGADGKDGKDGQDGSQGPAGADGQDGQDGADGVSVTSVSINASNHLVVTLSDGTDVDAGLMPELSSETVTVSGDTASKQLTSHKLCYFDGALVALTITLPQSISVGDEFNFIFTTSVDSCILTVPNTVKWDGGTAPTLEANTLYEVSIDGLGIALISQGVSTV